MAENSAQATTEAQQPAVTTPPIAPKKSNKGLLIALIVIGVLILLAIIVLIIVLVSRGNTTPPPPPPPQQQETPTPQPQTPPPAEGTSIIEITSPNGDGTVTGQFSVEGKATATLQELTIEVYDNDDVLLGTAIAGLASGDPEPIHTWVAQVDLTQSPGTLTGRILAFPLSEGSESELLTTQVIKFSEQTSAGRIRLFAPLSQQVTSSSPVTFRGEMKDFFEGVLEIRLKTSAGTTIFSDFIMAEGDNYGSFATFQKDVEFEPIPLAAGDAGTWELFETSAADGSETVLLTLPVRFVE